MMDAKKIVSEGYDLVSEAYRSDEFDYEKSMDSDFLPWLENRLEDNSRVLDLGCGCGIPVAKVLSKRFRVTGVDISAVQVERARKLVPEAEFRQADFSELAFPSGSFEAITAFYSIIHLPLDEQPALFDSMKRWLVPGGFFLASVGYRAWTGTEPDWRGVSGATMYWSHSDGDTYRGWLEERGFEIVEEGFVPENDSGFSVFLAQRGAGD
jgi:SAM-dependent methyltransferase